MAVAGYSPSIMSSWGTVKPKLKSYIRELSGFELAKFVIIASLSRFLRHERKKIAGEAVKTVCLDSADELPVEGVW